MTRAGSLGAVVARHRDRGELVVQPRMGFSDPARMRAGLQRTRAARAATVGTITLDSYTRVGDEAAAALAVRDRRPLNGFPLLTHGPSTTRRVVDGITGHTFPVQVRHGSARPERIVAGLVAAGLHATEGGPVSYCLPYGRTPLRVSVESWTRACELLAETRGTRAEPHLETFGGCLLGQLCPPGMLVAVSVLEGLFFARLGLRSVSLSYAQQANADQDAEAVGALRRLAGELLEGVDWHVVLYTYMGVYPRTAAGARRLLEQSAGLAVRVGVERLIVKTTAEAHRIPTIDENVEALETAAAVAAATPRPTAPATADNAVYAEARALTWAVLNLHNDLGRALVLAFERGYLDVPYCLHPDNAGRSRSFLDSGGRLRWSSVGAMPVQRVADVNPREAMGSADLLAALTYVERRFDGDGTG